MTRVPFRRRPFTYDDVGITRRDDATTNPPSGFRGLERTARIGSGAAAWTSATREILNWGIQSRSGFRMRGPKGDPRIPLQVDDIVTLGIAFGPMRFDFPARVVYVIDEPDRRGFAYGTLAGHAESGEESFVVERRRDGSVWVVIRAVSRPSTPLWRLVDPALRVVQAFYINRYLRALAETRTRGTRRTESSRVLGSGDALWVWARDEVLGWGVKTRSGFTVDTPGEPVREGDDHEIRIRIGPIQVREPVTVAQVIDEQDAAGFSYTTRPGHPLVGEESFLLERGADGRVTLTVRSAARVAPSWRLLTPLLRIAQRRTTARYLRALRKPPTGTP